MVDNAGIRKRPGTVIKVQATGEIVHTPPQDENEIRSLLADLERFVNDNSFCAVDPLIKMAIAHHQFESIHPFYDGNGRAGRILNSLYLVAKGLLDRHGYRSSATRRACVVRNPPLVYGSFVCA